MSNSLTERNIALAGVCQAAALVQMFARKASAPDKDYRASIKSLVITDPDNTEQIFGGIENLQTGLKTLIAQLGNAPLEKDAEITRYVASILGLERKLSRQPKKMQELGERISQIQRQTDHLDLFEDQMISNLASVYSEVVSPLGTKIQVAGLPANLKQASIQHKVRALLLAGVRAAVLWRQLGGQRRQILFNRRKIVASVQSLITQPSQFH